MKFSREELRKIGIEDEKLEQVMKLHGSAVDSLNESVSQKTSELEAAISERDSYKQRVEDQSNQLDELNNKVKNGEDLTEQIEALKNANKAKDDEHAKQVAKVKLNYEIEKELMNANARNSKAVLALIDSEVIKLNDEGNGVKGLSEQLEALKESDGYLFNDVTDNANDDEDKTDFTYNAGNNKGNAGQEGNNDIAIGKAAAARLLGNK